MRKTLWAFWVLALFGTVLVFGSGKKEAGGEPVRIGSKDFTESFILAEIYALALENGGIPVERNFGLASNAVHAALVSNSIDLYPEYTGTGLLAVCCALRLKP